MHLRRLSTAFIVVLILYTTGCDNDDSSTNSQLTGKIVGSITDARSSQPLLGATATTNPPTQTAVADSNGSYNISKIAAGRYTVTASKTGYISASIDVTVRSDTLVWANFKLTPQ